MAEDSTKLPVKTEQAAEPFGLWPSMRPFRSLRREVDRLFEDFDRSSWRSPFHAARALEPFFHSEMKWPAPPAVDVVETENEFKVTAELPGMDEKNIEVFLANNALVIKGEKREEKEEKKQDYFVQERRYGSFERRLDVPATVDAAKIEASFKQGVLTVTLPKTAEAKKPQQKIEVKTA